MNKSLQTHYSRAKKVYDLKELERLGLTPDGEQRQQILTYLCLLFKWNKAAGLISPKDEEIVFVRHFCDSLQPLLLFGFKRNATVLDIGAGGGFPAIPIRILRPDLTFTLTESNRKKASFLSEVKTELGLENLTIHNGRVERLDPEEVTFDYVVCRGVGSLKKFSQLAKPYVATDGRMYTFKTKQFEGELEEITTNKERDGVRIAEIAEYDLANQIFGLNLVSLALV